MNGDQQHTMTAAEYDDGRYDPLPHQSLAHQYSLYSDAVKRDDYHRQDCAAREMLVTSNIISKLHLFVKRHIISPTA